jgi:3-deoxy-manno-octulosonate cytidylyltransferase (CMP-KDO synthetase)
LNSPFNTTDSEALRFTVLIPARMASTRLPNKPLADINRLPMVVRVAQRAALSSAAQVVVATDSPVIVQACEEHGVRAVLTRADHPSGSDRLAEACTLLGLHADEVVVNVQGDEPLIDPALINAVARLLQDRPDCAMSTAAHAIDQLGDYLNRNIVKVVLDARNTAAHPSPWAATLRAPPGGRHPACRRHCGMWAFTATVAGFCASSHPCRKRPLSNSNP